MSDHVVLIAASIVFGLEGGKNLLTCWFERDVIKGIVSFAFGACYCYLAFRLWGIA